MQRTCNAKISPKRERERESSSRLDCHTERSEVPKNANANVQNPLDISVSTKTQYDKANAGQYNKVDSIANECNPISSPSLAGGDSTYSPSLSASGGESISSPSFAEGVRGWVDTTSALQVKPTTASEYGIFVIASERSERGKTRRSRSFFSNDESFYAFSNAKDTHPQTPLVLREGDFKKPSHTRLCAKVSLVILAIITTASINILIALEYTKLCAKSIISSHTDFCKQSSTDYLTDFAPRSAIDFANPTKQQNYTDFRNFADSTPYAIPRPKDISAFLWIENWRDTYFLYVYNLTPMRNPQYLRGELKGQISFRAPIIPKFFSQNWIFYLAFTNTFYFQLFNEKASSPMRDNDFQPEFLLTYRHKNRHKGDFEQGDRFSLTEITFGWRHISNGEIDKAQGGVADRSRGSDRFILKARFSNKHWGFDMEAFVPTRFYKENLDIYKYLGSFEAKVNMRYGNHLADFSLGGLLGVLQPPYSIAKSHSTPYFRTSYTYKINEYYGLYMQYFVGYGDILSMNTTPTRIE
ncbi:phospholipase A [Helicobacter sp. MIT 01-3238]|uniref:phospholipase A n=1 Tax=Helicobacter sp. MIT 01-3238 TaxID=398627 RepID=UPI000E1F923A|nr:phospholipase A [Helicobacter sp. MIT 01-3238]RDU53602.1 hypothetical protein CQA40_04735 [Helicobacter sp. MIT 01-3238]